ncbi:hypothetical protein N9937_00360 [bacterium]|nr:hypothetical protein [bacterium]
MRGATAKAIRRAAEAQAAHLPVTKYYDTVEGTKVFTDPVTMKVTQMQMITTRLEPECKRAVYKVLKDMYLIANGRK